MPLPPFCVNVTWRYRRRRRINGMRPMIPVAVSASEAGSGTVLLSVVSNMLYACGGRLSVLGMNGGSFDGLLSVGPCGPASNFVVPAVNEGELSAGGGVVASPGAELGEDCADPPVGDCVRPLAGVIGVAGVVELWNPTLPELSSPLWPECANARKSPAPAAAPVPASHSPRWAWLPLSAGAPD